MKSRRDFLKELLKAPIAYQVANLGLTASRLAIGEVTPKRRNILFIAVDDLNDWIGCYSPKIFSGLTPYTPNIDRFAKEAMLFENAHTPYSLCNPARTAIFFGAEPHLSGVVGNYNSVESEFYHRINCYFSKRVSLNAYFREKGYETIAVGKLYHGFDERATDGKFHRLVDIKEKDPNRCRLFHFQEHPLYPKRVLYDQIDTGTPREGCPDGIIHIDEYTANKTIEMLKEKVSEQLANPNASRFFLGMGIFRPHSPYYAPTWCWNKYSRAAVKAYVDQALSAGNESIHPALKAYFEKRQAHNSQLLSSGEIYDQVHGYLASITFADYCIGKVLDYLRTTALWKDTIVTLWSDHGYHNGEKLMQHKQTLWERATRIPIIVRVPGLNEGTRSKALVSSLGLYKTLAELCFPVAERPADIAGVSFAPVLQDPKAKVAEAVRTALSLDTDDMKISSTKAIGYAVRDANWRYILYRIQKTEREFVFVEELYYLPDDPMERYNLVLKGRGKYEAVVVRLRKHIPTAFNQLAPLPQLNCTQK